MKSNFKNPTEENNKEKWPGSATIFIDNTSYG